MRRYAALLEATHHQSGEVFIASEAFAFTGTPDAGARLRNAVLALRAYEVAIHNDLLRTAREHGVKAFGTE